MNYGIRFVTLYRRQGSRPSPWKSESEVAQLCPTLSKKCKKAKWLSGEALQITEESREAKGKGKKERHTQLNAEFQRIANRDKKAFLKGQ